MSYSGALAIRYVSKHPIDVASIKLDKKDASLYEAGVILSEVFTTFAATEGRQEEQAITLPATPGLGGIKELVILCRSDDKRAPMDLTISGLQFVPLTQ